jgi:hypothetical protein
MSSRIGNPVEQVVASGALGAAGGRVIPLNNQGWVLLTSVSLLYSASATAGNRQVALDLKDAAGNILFRGASGTAITTTQVVRINMGGITSSTVTAPAVQNISTPTGMSLPPLSTLTVVDTANVDTTDTVAGAIVVSN